MFTDLWKICEEDKCENTVRLGSSYCGLHHNKNVLFRQWIEEDGLIQFEVLSKEIRKTLYRVYKTFSRNLYNIQVTEKDPKQKLCFFDKDLSSEITVCLVKDKKTYTYHARRQNLTEPVYKILMNMHCFKKYRRLTKEYRKIHGIKDKTYEEAVAKERKFTYSCL